MEDKKIKKRKHDFREMSDRRCIDCNAPLKKNLVEKCNASRCYVCHNIKNGNKSTKITLGKNKFVQAKDLKYKTIDFVSRQVSNKKKYRSNA